MQVRKSAFLYFPVDSDAASWNMLWIHGGEKIDSKRDEQSDRRKYTYAALL